MTSGAGVSRIELLAIPADIIARLGGIGRIEIPVFLQHRKELNRESFVLSVPAFSPMLHECAHEKEVRDVQRFFGHFIDRVTFDEEGVFVGELHTKMVMRLKKGRRSVDQRTPSL